MKTQEVIAVIWKRAVAKECFYADYKQNCGHAVRRAAL